jgi:hypothetical protein
VTARAVSVNVTVTGPTGSGAVTLFQGDAAAPGTSNLNFQAGQTRANNAVLGLARNGAGTLVAKAVVAGAGQTHLILDVNGYFQ